MVISLDLIIIILLLIGCSISTYSDINFGEISNKTVLVYGSIPILCNWVSVSLEGVWSDYIVNALIVIIIAILLYIFHVWAGGDCKMLFLIALAMPVNYYWSADLFPYNFCFIYAFIFSFGFIYICFDNIKMFYLKRHSINKGKILNEFKASIYKYVRTIIYLSAIGHIFLIFVYPYFEVPVIIYSLLCIAFILIISRITIFSYKRLVVVVAVFDFIVFIVTGNLTISTMWHTYVIVIALMLLRAVSNTFNYEDVKTCDVKRGMILSKESSIILQKSRVKGLPTVSDESLKSRLSEREADAVRRWAKSKYGLDSIRVVRKMPFAIFITFGLVVYFVMGCVYY